MVQTGGRIGWNRESVIQLCYLRRNLEPIVSGRPLDLPPAVAAPIKPRESLARGGRRRLRRLGRWRSLCIGERFGRGLFDGRNLAIDDANPDRPAFRRRVVHHLVVGTGDGELGFTGLSDEVRARGSRFNSLKGLLRRFGRRRRTAGPWKRDGRS